MTDNQFQMDAAEVAAVVSTGYRLFEQGRLKEQDFFSKVDFA